MYLQFSETIECQNFSSFIFRSRIKLNNEGGRKQKTVSSPTSFLFVWKLLTFLFLSVFFLAISRKLYNQKWIKSLVYKTKHLFKIMFVSRRRLLGIFGYKFWYFQQKNTYKLSYKYGGKLSKVVPDIKVKKKIPIGVCLKKMLRFSAVWWQISRKSLFIKKIQDTRIFNI